MGTSHSVDQLPGDAHAIAALAYRPFEHVAHTERSRHVLHIYGLALVSEGRITRDHEQPTDAAQFGDDVLDDAVGKVFLLRIAAHVLERQHGDGGLVG